MTPWVVAGIGVAVAEAWTWKHDPDNVLSRICGRHPWRTAAVAVAFLAHTNTHRIKWRKR